MDLTENFERLFTGKHFTSDAEFEQACETFKKETGCRFARRHVIYRQTPLEGLPHLLLKQGQFTCSVSYCDAFFAVGSKKSGVYVTRFNMHHIHGPMPEETYNVVCDLTDDFRQFFRVDRYQTYNEFHDLLVAFQAHTGSSYVKRHTVRWPADAVDRQHLVYARAHFECVRYGWSESSATSRPVVSKRIGCKAYVVIQTYKGWVEIFHLNMQHNHEITHEDAGHIPRQPRRFRAAVTANKQENHQDIKSVIDLGDYAYVGTPGESVGPPPEFIPQSIRRLRRRPRSQLPATSEGNSGKEEEGVENYLVEDGELSVVRHHEQALREDTEQTALLNGHVDAIRQLAVDFCLIDPNGEVSDLALDMCEELRQMEMEWRRALVESAEQQEAAPILVEFASASSSVATVPATDSVENI